MSEVICWSWSTSERVTVLLGSVRFFAPMWDIVTPVRSYPVAQSKVKVLQ